MTNTDSQGGRTHWSCPSRDYSILSNYACGLHPTNEGHLFSGCAVRSLVLRLPIPGFPSIPTLLPAPYPNGGGFCKPQNCCFMGTPCLPSWSARIVGLAISVQLDASCEFVWKQALGSPTADATPLTKTCFNWYSPKCVVRIYMEQQGRAALFTDR